MNTQDFFAKYKQTLYSMMQTELADRNKPVPNLVINSTDRCATTGDTIYIGDKFAKGITGSDDLSEAELFATYMGALGHEIQHIRSTPMLYYGANINNFAAYIKLIYPNFPNPEKFAQAFMNILEDARINRIRIYNSFSFAQYSAYIYINLLKSYDPIDKITGLEQNDFNKIVSLVYFLALCGELPSNFSMPDCIPDVYATEIPNLISKCIAAKKCKQLGANAIDLFEEIMKYAKNAVNEEKQLLQNMFNNNDPNLDKYSSPDHNLTNTTAGDYNNQDEKQLEQSLDDDEEEMESADSQNKNSNQSANSKDDNQSANGGGEQDKDGSALDGHDNSQGSDGKSNDNDLSKNDSNSDKASKGAGGYGDTPVNSSNSDGYKPRPIENDLDKYPLGNPIIKKTPDLDKNLNKIIHDIKGRIGSSFDNTATKVIYDVEPSVTPKSLSLKREIDFVEKKRDFCLDIPLPVDLMDKGKRFKKKVRKFFEQQAYILNNQSSGKINKHQLTSVMQGKTNIFMQHDGENIPQMCAYFLIDNSGSMNGINQKYAFDTMAIIEEGFKEFIPLKIVAYDDEETTVHHVVKGWNESQRFNCCFNFRTHESPCGGTPTEDSVEIATAELMARPEEKKLLFIVTDGEPNNVTLTKNAVALARKKGLLVFPVMIAEDADEKYAKYFTNIFGRSVLCNPEQVDEVLFGEINRKMLTIEK